MRANKLAEHEHRERSKTTKTMLLTAAGILFLHRISKLDTSENRYVCWLSRGTQEVSAWKENLNIMLIRIGPKVLLLNRNAIAIQWHPWKHHLLFVPATNKSNRLGRMKSMKMKRRYAMLPWTWVMSSQHSSRVLRLTGSSWAQHNWVYSPSDKNNRVWIRQRLLFSFRALF